jgi:uncharacterized integral membrane protein
VVGEQGKQTNWRAWAIVALVALVLIVCLQNFEDVKVDVLFATFDAPLIVALLIAVCVGAVIGYAAPVIIRHRRAEARTPRP